MANLENIKFEALDIFLRQNVELYKLEQEGLDYLNHRAYRLFEFSLDTRRDHLNWTCFSCIYEYAQPLSIVIQACADCENLWSMWHGADLESLCFDQRLANSCKKLAIARNW